MKGLKVSLIITIFLAFVGFSSMALAFHSGGVADCDGCHTMHGVFNGNTATPTTQDYLLQGNTKSETCLACHGNAANGSYHIMTTGTLANGVPPVNYTPGGDFAWLTKTYTAPSGYHWSNSDELGERHGHNVNAPLYNIQTDTTFTQAPGGTGFQSSSLECTSCHDPHGKYRRTGNDTTYTISNTGAPIIGSGSYATSAVPAAGQAVGVYRLLAGQNYSMNKGTLPINYPGSPIASVPSAYNPATGEATNQVRVAYGYAASVDGKTSWGQWCGTCHVNMVSGTGTHVHPIDVSLSSGGEDAIYNSYVSSGVMTANVTNSYQSLVPFMENTDDIATLKTHAVVSSTSAGPWAADRVSCLSCHRAHASGFSSMMRWDMVTNEFITDGTPQWKIAASRTPTSPAEAVAAYYGKPATLFNAYQRSLCNKCHAKD